MDKAGTTEQPDDSVIRFACKHCQRRISVPKIHAGKKGKCPECKNIIVVPKVESTEAAATQSSPVDSKVGSKRSGFNLTFLDIPQNDKTLSQPITQDYVSEKTFEDLRELEEETETGEAEPVLERKLPWLIDIFLYPISVPGLIILAIIIVIPLLINIVAKLFGPFGFFISIPGFVIKIVIGLYTYWYFCECIRDSTEGGLRAPDVLVNAPGLGDMLWQTLRVVGCLVFFSAPMLIYFRHTKEVDTIF